MILVFILLSVLILVSGLLLILFLSSIQLNVQSLHIENRKQRIELNFKAIISISFLKIFPYFQVTITKQKMQKWIQEKKIDIQKFQSKNGKPWQSISQIKDLGIEVKELELSGFIGTFEPILTSYLYVLVQAFVPILIARKRIRKYKNELRLLNAAENIADIELECIISVPLVNIISTIIRIKKKGGRKKNGKSSNRKSYAYGYE